MTGTDSLDDLLDNTPDAKPEHQAPAETGDKQDAAPPADVTQPAAQAEPAVPRKALEDERRKRQELERKVKEYEAQFAKPAAQPQVPQQPMHIPDPIAEPDQWAAYVVQVAEARAMQRAEEAQLNRELNRSEKRARKAHGDEVVDQALAAAKAQGRARDFLAEDDVYDALVSWYRREQAMAEIGDPLSYREKLRAEIMAELQGTAPAQRQRAPVPKSLASATNTQPRDKSGRYVGDGPTPLEDIIG